MSLASVQSLDRQIDIMGKRMSTDEVTATTMNASPPVERPLWEIENDLDWIENMGPDLCPMDEEPSVDNQRPVGV